MSAKKTQKKTEGKYEQLCREYEEREELEKLNKRCMARVEEMDRIMWEAQARAEMERLKQEKRFAAAVKLVFVVIMSLVIIASLMVFAYTETFAWWISISLSGLLTIVSAFKAGYFWHEIRN
jgi:cation transport ATPase